MTKREQITKLLGILLLYRNKMDITTNQALSEIKKTLKPRLSEMKIIRLIDRFILTQLKEIRDLAKALSQEDVWKE